MAELLTWVMERRTQLGEQAERLRKELRDIEAECERLAAAEQVVVQFREVQSAADDGSGQAPAPGPPLALSPTTNAVLAVPHRADGMAETVLPEVYQAVLQVVSSAGGPVKSKDVCSALGRDVQPRQVEGMRGKLKRLADRGWLHQTPQGRFTLL